MKPGDEGEIQIDSRVPFQQARQAIKYLVDASVELVTNCDDSYRRLNVDTGGTINVEYHRMRRSEWEYFRVSDSAEGMEAERLQEALTYGAITSGFVEGRPVRGLWGRGLKETILAIGTGVIETVSQGQYIKVEMWWDDAQQTARWRTTDLWATDAPNGTTITVSPAEHCNIRAPIHRTFLNQLANHYSLRDIWTCREGKLTVSGSPGGSLSLRESPIRFTPPNGELVLTKRIETPFGPAVLTVWESPSPLAFNRTDPSSLAGFVIKSENASLDNTLLGLETTDELARCFWGHIVCDGIAGRIRDGDDSLLTTIRQGLDWRHRSLRDFQSTVAEAVRPLIEERRRRLSQSTTSNIPDSLKRSLTRLLNQLARDELSESGDGPGSDPGKIEDLVIRPSRGTAAPGEPRSFGIYFPSSMAIDEQTIVDIKYESENQIRIAPESVTLREHPVHSTLLYGRFDAYGEREGDEAYIFASTETDTRHEDVAHFIAGTFERRPPKDVGGGRGGFIREIEYDSATDPQQRVQFSDGTIRIFQEFPGISQYLPDEANTSEGKAMLAELVLEAFCRQVARARLDRGDVVYVPGGEIDAFNAEVNRLLKKSMALVHELIINRF